MRERNEIRVWQGSDVKVGDQRKRRLEKIVKYYNKIEDGTGYKNGKIPMYAVVNDLIDAKYRELRSYGLIR